MHALRLGVQGAELLTTGRITLRIPEPELGLLRAVRRGEVSLAEVIAEVDRAEARLLELSARGAVPDGLDRAWESSDWLQPESASLTGSGPRR